MILPVIFANLLAVNTLNSDIAKIISFLNLVIFSRDISREKVFRSQIKPSHGSLLEIDFRSTPCKSIHRKKKA
jgi:hypothetical protein